MRFTPDIQFLSAKELLEHQYYVHQTHGVPFSNGNSIYIVLKNTLLYPVFDLLIHPLIDNVQHVIDEYSNQYENDVIIY
jgi:hypothetical protein